MLALILADGDVVGLIQQDIRRHEAGIGEQAAVYVVGVLGALVLELGHAAQLAEHGVAVEDPAQLRVLVDVALDEQGVLLRIEAAGDILCKLLERAAAQLRGILPHGEGVQVGHEVVAVKLIGPRAPVLDRAQIVAQMQVAGGLDAREHYFFLYFVFHGCTLLFIQIIAELVFYHFNCHLTTRKIQITLLT